MTAPEQTEFVSVPRCHCGAFPGGLCENAYGCPTPEPRATPDECCCPQHGRWIKSDDVDRLVREIDVAINGEQGAARQASLCDIASQIVHDCDFSAYRKAEPRATKGKFRNAAERDAAWTSNGDPRATEGKDCPFCCEYEYCGEHEKEFCREPVAADPLKPEAFQNEVPAPAPLTKMQRAMLCDLRQYTNDGAHYADEITAALAICDHYAKTAGGGK